MPKWKSDDRSLAAAEHGSRAWLSRPAAGGGDPGPTARHLPRARGPGRARALRPPGLRRHHRRRDRRRRGGQPPDLLPLLRVEARCGVGGVRRRAGPARGQPGRACSRRPADDGRAPPGGDGHQPVRCRRARRAPHPDRPDQLRSRPWWPTRRSAMRSGARSWPASSPAGSGPRRAISGPRRWPGPPSGAATAAFTCWAQHVGDDWPAGWTGPSGLLATGFDEDRA